MKKLILIAVIGFISISCNAQSINKDSLYMHKIDSLTNVTQKLSDDINWVYLKVLEFNKDLATFRVKVTDDQLIILDIMSAINKK